MVTAPPTTVPYIKITRWGVFGYAAYTYTQIVTTEEGRIVPRGIFHGTRRTLRGARRLAETHLRNAT